VAIRGTAAALDRKLRVQDADEAARRTEELGGAVLLPPVDVPEMGRAAVLRDPQGGVFGVFAS
jgi:hypothetical protein